MTLFRFHLLRLRAQFLHVMLEGTYLAQRWHRADSRKLYYVPDGGRGFFAETGFDEARDCFIVLSSSTTSVLLAVYTQDLPLPAC